MLNKNVPFVDFCAVFLWLLCVKTVQYVHLYIVEYAENSCFVSSGCLLLVQVKFKIDYTYSWEH